MLKISPEAQQLYNETFIRKPLYLWSPYQLTAPRADPLGSQSSKDYRRNQRDSNMGPYVRIGFDPTNNDDRAYMYSAKKRWKRIESYLKELIDNNLIQEVEIFGKRVFIYLEPLRSPQQQQETTTRILHEAQMEVLGNGDFAEMAERAIANDEVLKALHNQVIETAKKESRLFQETLTITKNMENPETFVRNQIGLEELMGRVKILEDKQVALLRYVEALFIVDNFVDSPSLLETLTLDEKEKMRKSFEVAIERMKNKQQKLIDKSILLERQLPEKIEKFNQEAPEIYKKAMESYKQAHTKHNLLTLLYQKKSEKMRISLLEDYRTLRTNTSVIGL